jgi:hypothetical protein
MLVVHTPKGSKKMHHKDLLNSAVQMIDKKHQDYGDYSPSFMRASIIASAMLNKDISSYDVAVMMMAVKMSRLAANNGMHQDSWIDLAAYTGFASNFAEQQKASSSDELHKARLAAEIANEIKTNPPMPRALSQDETEALVRASREPAE